jgi:hypothetical protein
MQISVITSSTIRKLQEFLEEAASHTPDVSFDFFFLRETDIAEMKVPRKLTTAFDLWRKPQPKGVDTATAKWSASQFKWMSKRDRSISAFATYFPGISSMDKDVFQTAVHGLTDAVSMAINACKLQAMSFPIIEAVCGVVAERCTCDRCQGNRVVAVFPDDAKQDRLIRGLKIVIRAIKQKVNQRFVIALELEPGNAYVLRDKDTLNSLMRKIQSDPLLRQHVGLNLDLGHMRLANVTPTDLEPHSKSIVHSHISDHPKMHTRDHPLGFWTNIAHRNEFDPYVELLQKRSQNLSVNPTKGELEFSNTLAVELEGCNRIEWVLSSVQEVRRLLARNGVPVHRFTPPTKKSPQLPDHVHDQQENNMSDFYRCLFM